jgi:hypothetical protein
MRIYGAVVDTKRQGSYRTHASGGTRSHARHQHKYYCACVDSTIPTRFFPSLYWSSHRLYATIRHFLVRKTLITLPPESGKRAYLWLSSIRGATQNIHRVWPAPTPSSTSTLASAHAPHHFSQLPRAWFTISQGRQFF